MVFPFENNRMAASVDAACRDRLRQIYAAMDRAYNRAAGHYGFACDRCRDSCCRSRFYHHTIIEYDYLVEGLKTLNSEKLNEVTSRALSVVDETARADKSGAAVRPMCPLNFDELCILYPYRPMICRLHGIPHELQKPGQNPINAPGCVTFDRRCSRQDYFKFDRTPFYRDMAMLEQEVRQAVGTSEKIRMTVAEMILART
jgi:Fe-S-cluster containining protein